MAANRRKIRKIGGSATVVKKVEFRPSKNKHQSNLDVQSRAKKQHTISNTATTSRQPPQQRAQDHDGGREGGSQDYQAYIDEVLAMEEDTFRQGEDIPPPASKTQSHYLAAWLPHRRQYLSFLFEESAPPDTHHCSQCNKISTTLWRCEDCCKGSYFCAPCCAHVHARSPFHRAQKWNGDYWQSIPLWQLGVRLHLGHGGSCCPGGADADVIGPEYELDSTAGERIIDEEERFGPVEDEDDDDAYEPTPAIHVGGFPSAPPVTSTGGSKFLVVVHTNGVHRVPYIRCDCQSGISDEYLFLRQQLFPATTTDIRTVFTFDVLRLFHLLNLVCKITAYAFYRFLRRLTCPALPSTVPNRERELRRVMRMWRNLTSYQRSGFGHSEADPQRGDLAIFCATCPQPGINLDVDYVDDINHPPVIRVLAADGNEKADHIRYRSSFPDVALTNGQGYMTQAEPYQEFLSHAESRSKRFEQKPTCHKYNVTKHANRRHANIDITGIAAHACARHSCFAPSSVVDFKRGERQMNIDYSLSQAMATTNMDNVPTLLILYDLMCQYQVHLQDRFEDSAAYLHWPSSLKTLVTGIGKFHVHAHQESCLYRFSPSYIPNAGQVDGEAMEPNWSVLNPTSKSVRTASLEHRTEVLDDHMYDANWGKVVNAAHTTAQRLKRATSALEVAVDDLNEIKAGCSASQIETWEQDIEAAETQRQEGRLSKMDIMRSNITKGRSRVEIELDMTQEELDEGALGETTWLALGIEIEDVQRVIITMVRKPHKLTTTRQQLNLEQRRQRLVKLIDRFNEAAELHMDDELDEIPVEEDVLPEHIQLPYPSRVQEDGQRGISDCLRRLQQKEQRLREGQANDILQRLRETISHLSFQFIGKVRGAQGTNDTTRSWRGVSDIVEDIRSLRLLYTNCRDRLICLSSTNHVHSQGYWELNEDDCKMSEAIFNPNARGLADSGLSWLWGSAGSAGPESGSGGSANDDVHLEEFYRLHFLRARAKVHRWQEEMLLNKYELRWTTAYFVHQAKHWRSLRDLATNSGGQRAHAAEQMAMWNALGQAAEAIALKANPAHHPFWELIR